MFSASENISFVTRQQDEKLSKCIVQLATASHLPMYSERQVCKDERARSVSDLKRARYTRSASPLSMAFVRAPSISPRLSKRGTCTHQRLLVVYLVAAWRHAQEKALHQTLHEFSHCCFVAPWALRRLLHLPGATIWCMQSITIISSASQHAN